MARWYGCYVACRRKDYIMMAKIEDLEQEKRNK